MRRRHEIADTALIDNPTVAYPPGHGVTAHHPLDHMTARDQADLRYFEYLSHLSLSLADLLVGRVEQSDHRLAELVAELVDDGVETNLDLFSVRQVGRFALRPDIEADDDRLGRRGQ